jgi:enoyl-CoA hydratase/carnithine racemase
MNIRTQTSNGVATLEIARPEKKNALSIAMYEAMTSALHAAHADDDVRALLIIGQPGVFTSGNDLEDFTARPPTGEDSPVFQFMRAVLAFEKPIIAGVTGAAIGIGVTLLLHCDLVYVAEDAKLATPFVSLGLVPEFGSSLAMPRLMGHVQAAEKLMLGTPFTGREAVQLGIANAALPAHEVLAHARSIAEKFNDLPPMAVRETKRLLRAKHKDHIEHAVRDEAAIFLERLKSPEAKEAFAAFFQKRKPDFRKR